MAHDVANDQFVLIRVEGMHCHKCERNIQKSLTAIAGVHEVEVDFASGQASVLFDPSQASPASLMQAVAGAGYRAAGFTKGQQRQQAS
jgi:copper chaperone CopZ